MANIMNNVLKQPLLNNLGLVNLADRIISYQTKSIRLMCPQLLIMHNVSDYYALNLVSPRYLAELTHHNEQ